MTTFISLLAAVIMFVTFYFYFSKSLIFTNIISLSNGNQHHKANRSVDSNIFNINFENVFTNASETTLEFDFDYRKMLKHYNLNSSVFFGLPFASGSMPEYHSIFRKLSDWIIDSDNAACVNVTCGDIVFVKTDYLKSFFENCYSNISSQFFVISDDSDYSVGYPWQLKYLNESKIVTWFGENVITRHPKLKVLPLGVIPANNYTMATFNEFATKNIIPFYARPTLVYLNFSPTTNKNRTSVIEYFKKQYENDSRVLIDETRIDWKIYLAKLKNSKFVISPPGNGLDCFRTWEALAMGAVPIVLKNELVPLYESMPVMVVNNWTEVTKENLQKFQHENVIKLSKDGIPWRPKIWFRYWVNLIMTEKFKYISNSCNK